MVSSSKLSFLRIPKPYISPQHGALITLIGVTFVGVLHSEATTLLQICAFIFAFSSFHAVELITAPKRVFETQKKFAYIYGCLALLNGTILMLWHPQFILLTTTLITLGALFFAIHKKNQLRTLKDLVSFALLIWISLYSVNTKNPHLILNLFAQTFLYFTFTVALIHWRLKKISAKQLIYLFAIEMAICLCLITWNGMPLLISIIALKALLFVAKPAY